MRTPISPGKPTSRHGLTARQVAIGDIPVYPGEEEATEGVIECPEFPDDGDDEEIQKNRVAPNPILPNAAEVEDHRISHLPFRSWCKECVLGKALGEQRGTSSASKSGPSRIAVVGVDYFYMTHDNLFRRDEMLRDYPRNEEGERAIERARNEGSMVKCLIVRCNATKLVFAHVVPVKGVDEDGHICELVASDIQWIGHSRLIIKADNEPALQTVVVDTMRRLRIKAEDMETLSKEQPERYESQSKGLIEAGVRNVRAQFRTLKACLECRIGKVACRPPCSRLATSACLPAPQRSESRRRRYDTVDAGPRAAIPPAAHRIRRDCPL